MNVLNGIEAFGLSYTKHMECMGGFLYFLLGRAGIHCAENTTVQYQSRRYRLSAWMMVYGIMEEDLGSIVLVFGARGISVV